MASVKPISIVDVSGGMNTADPTTIADNQFADLQNMFYDTDAILTTRRGSAAFGAAIASVSSVHSLQFHKKSSGTRYLLAGAGSAIYLYDDTLQTWSSIKTGLTSGQRFSSVMYKDVIYITNGVDNYMSYDGASVTEHAAVPKGKYLVVANDVAYLAGVSGDASIVYYTNANPADLTSFPNDEPINEDDGQSITGLGTNGPLLIVFKERSSYIFNSATPSVDNTDYDGGCKAGRTITKVENDTYFLSENGVFSLAQRSGTTGALRGDPISKNIQNRLVGLQNRSIACAIYWPATSNFYLAVDDEDSGNNRTIFVLSILTKGWTYYTGINANEFCIYEDSDGVEHLLAANPYGGQVIEMETGFSDQDAPISWNITTKTYDFGSPGRLLIYERADFSGFHSQASSAAVTVAARNISEVSKTKHISYSSTKDGSSSSLLDTLGARTLGSSPLGGSTGGSNITLYPFQRYMPLYLTGRYVGMNLSGSENYSVFALTKINLWPIPLSKDTVAQNLYI